MMKGMKYTVLLFVLITTSSFLHAQSVRWKNSDSQQVARQKDGEPLILIDTSKVLGSRWDHLTIISDSRIDTLLSVYREERNRKGTIDGYRVQIFSGKKEDAFNINSRFRAEFPGYDVHIKFSPPDFYVRVGDFRTRSEAVKLKYLIMGQYADPFIVEDQINYPKLDDESY